MTVCTVSDLCPDPSPSPRSPCPQGPPSLPRLPTHHACSETVSGSCPGTFFFLIEVKSAEHEIKHLEHTVQGHLAHFRRLAITVHATVQTISITQMNARTPCSHAVALPPPAPGYQQSALGLCRFTFSGHFM